MFHNIVAEHIFGTMGTICWTGQLVPQIWKSWREKSTEGLAPLLVLLWGLAGPFLGVYAILYDINIPLIIQPQLFCILCLISWGQCLYYGSNRSRTTAILITSSVIITCGVLETIFVLVLRPFHDRSQHTPTDVFGIVASAIIAIALLPQYWEIYKHKEVIGVSMVFISIDFIGAIFNDLSLVFKEELDVIAVVTYSIVVVMDGLVILAAIILNPLAHRRRRRQAAQNMVEVAYIEQI